MSYKSDISNYIYAHKFWGKPSYTGKKKEGNPPKCEHWLLRW